MATRRRRLKKDRSVRASGGNILDSPRSVVITTHVTMIMRANLLRGLPNGRHPSGQRHLPINKAQHCSSEARLSADTFHGYRELNRCISACIAVNACTSITRPEASRATKRFSARASVNKGDANPAGQTAALAGLWSVIIPTYDRLPILTACLQALEEQLEGSPDYEVVVVDDGSTDGTPEFLNANRSRFPHVKLVIQEHGGATAARNLGVSQSQGSTIVFIDSDMVVCPGEFSFQIKNITLHTGGNSSNELSIYTARQIICEESCGRAGSLCHPPRRIPECSCSGLTSGKGKVRR